MKILKFGGTSVGSIEGLQQIDEIILNTQGPKIVVCSAMSGITDTLLNLVKNLQVNNKTLAYTYLSILKERHNAILEELFPNERLKIDMQRVVHQIVDRIVLLTQDEYSIDLECEIITYGERLLTEIYSAYLTSIQIKNVLLDARHFMVVDEIEKPDINLISKKINEVLAKYQDCDLFITQGFIRVTAQGRLRHLDRGGSDYSATLIGAALGAEEVQIWSDVDGFHNCDPKVIKDTFSIPYLSYDEAAELAYFGAKILHPQTVFPAKKLEIPLLLKNTFDREGKGTVISSQTSSLGRKAISVKNNLMSLKIVDLQKEDKAYWREIFFSALSKHEITIYFTSQIEDYIEIIVVQNDKVDKVLEALDGLVKVSFKKDLSIVCLVGYHSDYDSDVKLLNEIRQVSSDEVSSYSDVLSTKIWTNSRNIVNILENIKSQLFSSKVE